MVSRTTSRPELLVNTLFTSLLGRLSFLTRLQPSFQSPSVFTRVRSPSVRRKGRGCTDGPPLSESAPGSRIKNAHEESESGLELGEFESSFSLSDLTPTKAAPLDTSYFRPPSTGLGLVGRIALVDRAEVNVPVSPRPDKNRRITNRLVSGRTTHPSPRTTS